MGKENSRLKQIILGNEMEIAAKDETIEELKKQVQGYLINYSDNTLVKVLRDCIIQNKKLSSQEQNQLSAWIECSMDFGTNLDECSIKLDKAKEIIKTFLGFAETFGYSPSMDKFITEVKDFLKESE